MWVVKVNKATVKGATRTGNLLWNITTEGVELDVARFITHVQTCLATNQAVANSVNTDYWLDKITRELGHTQDVGHSLQNTFALPVKRATYKGFVAKSILLSAFLNNFFANLQQLELLQDRFD